MPFVHITTLWKDLSPTGRRTFKWDFLRATCDAAGNSFIQTISLLVAIRYFHCSLQFKSLIAAGSYTGMALGFLYANYSHYWIGKRNIEAAIPIFLSALCLWGNALTDSSETYSLLAFFGAFFFSINFPLMTALYRENYRPEMRGQVFSLSLLVGGLSGAILTYWAGLQIELGASGFRTIMGAFGTLVFVSAVFILRIPSKRHPHPRVSETLASFKVLWEDPRFVYVLGTWFIFGIANLGLLPQRLEYLSSTEYGIALSPAMVALVVGVVPELTRMVMVIPMGWFFDRMNFILLRILINVLFFFYTLVFFHTSNFWVLILGSVFLGAGLAGGSISWNLWVTKYAKPSDTAKYMAMHTFFNGVRGILGPYFGYVIASSHGIPNTALVATALVVISCLMLLPLLKEGAPYDPGKMEEAIADGEVG